MNKPTNTETSTPGELTVTVKTFATEVAAEAAAACLEANGVPCWLAADDCGGMLPTLDNYAGVRLKVAAEDAESARDILSREGVPPPDSDDDAPPTDGGAG